ncbi:MAG: DUF2339 domain-containing protein [Hyphomonadaceae bacterium]|nr:DUF2339 domain-containing protein [Hyphomonadaceae bacterium]
MELAIIIILGVVVVVLWARVTELTERIAALERRVSALAPEPETSSALEPLLLDKVLPPEDEQEPLILTQVVGPDELVLDTPLPQASNDDATALAPAPLATPEPDAAPLPPREPDRRLEQWLAANWLPWGVGAGLALAAFGIVWALAGKTWLIPPFQLAVAAALTAALIGASEWVRRTTQILPPERPQLAAFLAGVGAAIFYRAVWSTHAIEGYTNATTALLLLALCAVGLALLSLRDGEITGAAAVVAALAAPALASPEQWPPFSLTVFMCAMAAGGFSLAAWRRWTGVALITLLGSYFWFASVVTEDEVRRALAMLSTASLGMTLIALRPAATETPRPDFDWAYLRAFGPGVAIAISSVLLLWVWLASAPAPAGRVAGPALIAAFHVALASYAVRARLASFWTLVIAIGATVLGFTAYLQARFHFGPQSSDLYPTIIAVAVVTALCTITARPHHSGRAIVAGAGAFGAAVLTALAASTRADWHSIAAWAPLFVGAALLFTAAWRAEEDAPDIENDAAIDVWAAAGVFLVLLGIESTVPAPARCTAHAGVALLLAAAHAWRGWRVLRPTALIAAVVALLQTLSPALAGAALEGAIPIWGALVITLATAALLFAAGYFLADSEPRSSWSEALTSAGVIGVLMAALLALRWFAAGGAGFTVDLMSEAALTALAFMAAGHWLLPRNGNELGLIGRWRGHAFMWLGVAYLLYMPGLALNPWWGGPARTDVVGPPLLDTLTLAFVVPALVAFAAAYRLYMRDRVFARLYTAIGGVLLLMWAALQVRYAFQGDEMPDTPIGWAEGGCYALIFIFAAIAITVTARVRAPANPDGPFTHDLLLIVGAGESVISAFASLIKRMRPEPQAGDLLTIKRDGRRGRRYRSS